MYNQDKYNETDGNIETPRESDISKNIEVNKENEKQWRITRSERQIKLTDRLADHELCEVYCLLSDDLQNYNQSI